MILIVDMITLSLVIEQRLVYRIRVLFPAIVWEKDWGVISYNQHYS